jgi:ligand-binding sensor domain-containing protein
MIQHILSFPNFTAMMLKQTIITFIISLLPCLSNGQVYDLEYYKAANGLSSNNATCVLVDKDEFVWVGTRTGLNRYDGTRFKIFMHSAAQPYSIGSDNITMLFEDKNGTLWIVHDRGLSKWNSRNHHFQNLLYEVWQMPQGTYISRIMDYDDRHLFVATTNGIVLIHKTTFQIKKVPLPFDAKLSAYIHDHTIWYLYHNRLFGYDTIAKKSNPISKSNLDQSTAAYISYYDASDESIYISTYNNGAYVYFTKTDTWQHLRYDYTIDNYDPMYSLKKIESLGIVFNTDYTMGRLDDDSRTMPLAAVKNLTNAAIRDFTYQGDNLWIATSQGLVHAQKPKINIHVKAKYPFVKDRYATLRYDKKDDVLYTSNYDYPYIYTIDSKENHHLLPTKDGYIKGGLRNFYRDRQDRLWVSTESEIYMLNSNEKYWENVRLDKDALPRNFTEDNEGQLYLRIRNKGIYKWNATHESFLPFMHTALAAEAYTGMAYMKGSNKITSIFAHCRSCRCKDNTSHIQKYKIM